MAVVKACNELRRKICEFGADILETDPKSVDFDGNYVFCTEDESKKYLLRRLESRVHSLITENFRL